MMANAVDQTIPQNSESPSLGAQRIRETRSGFNNILTVEHDISDDATTKGFHGTNVTGKVAGSITTPPSGYGRFGWKTISGVAELFYKDDAGNEIQLTSAGSINLGFPPTGSISMYGGASAPSGWLLCDGSAVSRTTYSALFAIISTTFGAGDGSTTFNVPKLDGRVPIGVGTGTDDNALTDTFTLAGTEGEYKNTLSEAEMPSHTHPVSMTSGTTGGTPTRAHGVTSAETNKVNTDSTGSGGSHNNIQPVIGLNFIIKT
jgi:microcystin-dependent protein